MEMRPASVELLHQALNAVPHPMLVVDDDIRLLWANRAALDFLAADRDDILLRRGGELLHCIHALSQPEGCGHGKECGACPIRGGVREAAQGGGTLRRQICLRQGNGPGGENGESHLLLTVQPFRTDGSAVALIILEDIRELHELRRLLPICAHCKRIRREDSTWESVEQHMKRHAAVEFTHGLCPDCLHEHYGNLFGLEQN